MILAVTIVILFLASPFVWWYMFVLQRYKSLKNIPGPKPLPIVGNALSLGNTPHDIYNNLKKFHREYGDIFKIYIGNELRVFITSPDLIREILTSNVHITKSDGYDLLKPWISEGILTSTGNKWKLRRRMITSSFHFKILDKFIEVFNSCGDILTKRLSQEVGNKCLNVYPYISLGAFDIVCQTSMGLKNSVQDGNNSEYVKTVRGFINIAMIRFFSAWERIDWMFEWFSKNAKTHSSYVKILHSFADNIIQIRRKEKDDKKLDNFDSESGVKKKSALLDMLLESEDSHNLSNDDIKEEINTVLFAGHDTSSSAISFILLCLAENPKIQEKVYEEIVSVMGQKDNNYVSIQDIQNMKYFDLVFKESQRLYATVPFIERRLEEDWSVGGYDFPRNTFLVIYMYGLHHDEKYFPDPYKFDPDRFLPENQSKRHVYSYIPFSAGPRNCVDIYNNLKKFHREYGDIFKIYIGNELRVFITSPDLIREILTSNVHITKSDGYDLLKPWISEGILTSTGNKWKLRRRMITSSFHFKILDKFIEVFNSCGDILTKRLSQEVGNKCLNVYPYISLGAFDIVCQTSMGLKNSVQDGNNSEYVKTVRGFINIAMIRFFSAWERIDWMFEWFSKNAKTHSSYVKILHSFADNIIQIRRKEKDDKKLDNFDSESGVKKKSALLDMLLESEDTHNLSNDDIKEEINTVLFAGHDTSSSAISFILLCLAENPKIQEKVYEEIVSVMGQKDNNYVSIQDIQNMKYFDLVFKESQRLYATVPFIERRLEEDWSVGGYDFPRNTFLVIYMYGLHHDEKYFPDPYKFDPDRFLPENQSKRHVYSYIPFSAGPRNCVGQKFAILAIKTIVIKILKNYRVVAVPGFKPKLEAAAVLKSLNGVCIELQQR